MEKLTIFHPMEKLTLRKGKANPCCRLQIMSVRMPPSKLYQAMPSSMITKSYAWSGDMCLTAT
jgi:hypothetical protein